MSSCSGKLMNVFSFFLWPVCLEEDKHTGVHAPHTHCNTLQIQPSASSHFAAKSIGRPVKDEAHELQVESRREAVEFDPAGGALLALAAFTEVAVLAIQLLLLQGGG